MLEYKKGTIVQKRNIIFKDGQSDPHCCHPAMIPVASDEISSDTYYLLITSQDWEYENDPDAYFSLSDCWEDAYLVKPSFINLKNIYKGHVVEKKCGGLERSIFKQVIQKLKAYQEEHPDEYYDELKSKLKA